MRVYKYQLIYGLQSLELPEGGEMLTVQLQRGWPHLWALVDSARPPQARAITIVGTGQRVPPGARYISTFTVEGSPFVFHAFEIMPDKEGPAP